VVTARLVGWSQPGNLRVEWHTAGAKGGICRGGDRVAAAGGYHSFHSPTHHTLHSILTPRTHTPATRPSPHSPPRAPPLFNRALLFVYGRTANPRSEGERSPEASCGSPGR
jgi:hypothetical protein